MGQSLKLAVAQADLAAALRPRCRGCLRLLLLTMLLLLMMAVMCSGDGVGVDGGG